MGSFKNQRRDKPWHDEYAPYYDAVRALTDMTLFLCGVRGGVTLERAELNGRALNGKDLHP